MNSTYTYAAYACLLASSLMHVDFTFTMDQKTWALLNIQTQASKAEDILSDTTISDAKKVALLREIVADVHQQTTSLLNTTIQESGNF